MTRTRHQLMILDRCLQLVEDALFRGKQRVDAPLARDLTMTLGAASLVSGQRLEGRRLDRVLDDIFGLQEGILARRAGGRSADEGAEEMVG